MLIDYNPVSHLFVAQFSQDFQGDLDACKAAKFMTSGPPDWTWYAPPPGLPALERIRKNKPASGLTITDAAYLVYQRLADIKAKNDEVKKLMKKAQAEAKKTPDKTPDAPDHDCGEHCWIGPKDLPPEPPYVSPYPKSIPPDLKCYVCQTFVYEEYMLTEPFPVCLWCEKVLDKK